MGKIAAEQNLTGIVAKLAREQGEQAREIRTGLAGVATRDGKPVVGGRVGAWQKARDKDRVNVAVHRGRTAPRGGYEVAWVATAADGSFAIEGLKAGMWYLVLEGSGRGSTVVGPIALKLSERVKRQDIVAEVGGSIEGRVEHIPGAMAGMTWVIAFDGAVTQAEARVDRDGTFRLPDLPPGRYGVKAGHDAYEDPQSLQGLKGEELFRHFRATSEPWTGAVVVEVKSGEAAKGAILDFRPPPPLPDPPPEVEAEAKPPGPG